MPHISVKSSTYCPCVLSALCSNVSWSVLSLGRLSGSLVWDCACVFWKEKSVCISFCNPGNKTCRFVFDSFSFLF